MTIIVYAPHFGEGATPPSGKGLIRDIRVLWALEELALPYDIRWLDFTKGEFKAPEYHATNPFGTIPAIRDTDGDVPVFESAAILKYLANKANALLPESGLGLDMWLHAITASIEPPVFSHFAGRTFTPDSPGNEWRQDRLAGQIDGWLSPVETHLAQQEWLLDRAFSIADLLLACVLRYTIGTPLLDEKPATAALLASACERPAFQRAFAIHLSGPS